MKSVFAIIAAAGNSQRMNGSVSKVLLSLEGKSVLERAVEPFAKLSIPLVILAPSQRCAEIEELFAGRSGISVLPGGSTRGESVSIGLSFIENEYHPGTQDVVLVHDAARCLVSSDLIMQVIEAAKLSGAAIPGLPVNDTLKRTSGLNRIISETVDRTDLFSVQTPQGFHFALLQRAYQGSDLGMTDDAGLVEKIAPVMVVSGCASNIKITRVEDLELAKFFLSLCPAS